MFSHTRAVFATTIEELKKLGYTFLLITQSLYIIFLIASISFGFGILVINILLLIASIIHLTLCIVSNKIDFENEEKIVTSGKKAYKYVKLGSQVFKIFSMLYGFFIASEQGSSLAIAYILITALFCIFQILIECITPIIKRKVELFVDAVKYDLEGVIKTVDFFNDLRGEKNLIWGDADKNRDFLKEMANDFKESKELERKQVRKERRIIRKEKFLSKFKK